MGYKAFMPILGFSTSAGRPLTVWHLYLQSDQCQTQNGLTITQWQGKSARRSSLTATW